VRPFLWCLICAVVPFGMAGCDDLSTSHAIEVHCVINTEFDNDKLCLKAESLGAEVEIRVNTATQKVQITVVKNDGNWFYKDYLLEHCSVVDRENWKCTGEAVGKPGDSYYMVREYGMSRGRYYTALTGSSPPDYYTSSISGLTFWALHYGFIDPRTAMARTGYSAKALSMFASK
jgi:hypothetical protein